MAWVNISNGDLGSSVREKLNKVGADMNISFRVVSAIAQVASEINFFTTNTVVYSIAEKVFYKYNGAAWVRDDDLPTGIYEEVTEIDDGDSPYDLGLAQNIIANTTGGDVTVNLTALSGLLGRRVRFKNIGTGTLTLDANASELIDAFLTLDLSQWESAKLFATSARWVIM